jgi:hypothetical protein
MANIAKLTAPGISIAGWLPQFRPNGIAINNPTGGWLKVEGNSKADSWFVPPYFQNWSRAFTSPTISVNITYGNGPAGQLGVVAGDYYECILTDQVLLNNDGYSTAAVPTSSPVTQATTPWVISGTVDTELPTAAALADNVANPTVPAVGSFNMIFNGFTGTYDRWRMAGGDIQVLGIPSVSGMIFNSASTGYNRIREPAGDAQAVLGFAGMIPMIWNGTNFYRLSALRPDGTYGPESVLQVSSVLYSGAQLNRPKDMNAMSDAQGQNGIQAVGPMIYTGVGTAYSRLREAPANDTTMGPTGLLAVAMMEYNERDAVWQRRRGPTVVGLLGLGARTTNQFIGGTKWSGIGVIIGIEITALAGGGTITMQVYNRIDTGGGAGTIMGDGAANVPILQTLALGAVGGYGFMIHPGITPVANVSVAKLLSKSYYINIIANGISVTYSIEQHEMV